MPASATAIEIPERAGCAVLNDVSWEFYEQMLEEFGTRRILHSYVDGELSIMSPIGFPHEHSKRLIVRLVDALTEEFRIPVVSLGNLTLKSAEMLRGAEPDDGYFVANEHRMRGKREYDPQTDPPPDLLIEIDVTSPSLNRLPVYAALGVPEVWVYDGTTVRVLLRAGDGYQNVEESVAFPFLPMDEFSKWVERAYDSDETTWILEFRGWLRNTVNPSTE